MATLIFDPTTGITVPDTQETRTRIAQAWKNAFIAAGNEIELNTEPVTPAGQLVDGETLEVQEKDGALLYLMGQLDPATNEGRFQDAIGNIYFIERHLDEPSIVLCRVSGIQGTSIPYGAQAKTESGVFLLNTEPSEIPEGGEIELVFRTAETGPIVIGAGEVNQVVTTIPGWDSITNSEPGIIGRDIETRAEFEKRRQISVAQNAKGSAIALQGYLANIDGVIDVVVLENISNADIIKASVTVPAHGVTVCIYGGDDTDIAQGIYYKKDNGADTGGNTEVTYSDPDAYGATFNYRIMRPDPTNFWVKVTLGAGVVLTDAQTAAIKSAVLQDFLGQNTLSGNPRVSIASDVYGSRFNTAVMAILGPNRPLKTIEVAFGGSQFPVDYFDYVQVPGDKVPVMTTNNVEVA